MRAVKLVAGVVVLVLVVWVARQRLAPGGAPGAGPEQGPVPVGVAPIERGPFVLSRTFSGSLEATAQFVAAPKVSGRAERLLGGDEGVTVEVRGLELDVLGRLAGQAR